MCDPYLLRNRVIKEVDEVWCADITYIPMEKGHAYLVAIMDWHSRSVLSWELSNTMDSIFCVGALKSAMALTGRKPKIFNIDQGSQFSSADWTAELFGLFYQEIDLYSLLPNLSMELLTLSSKSLLCRLFLNY